MVTELSWSRKIHYRIHKTWPLDFILRWLPKPPRSLHTLQVFWLTIITHLHPSFFIWDQNIRGLEL